MVLLPHIRLLIKCDWTSDVTNSDNVIRGLGGMSDHVTQLGNIFRILNGVWYNVGDLQDFGLCT